ncbi:MAG: TetR/AcrR family transcriptional regulator [Beijerinckiaceae bacterium]
MSRPSDARTRLIRAATKLFRQKGYDGVGLTEILKEADAPKGSFYHHFPEGKEQLGAAAVTSAGTYVCYLADLAFNDAADLLQGLDRLAQGIADGFEKSNYLDGCPITGVALDNVPRSTMITAAVRDAFTGWQTLLVRHAHRLGEPAFTMDDALMLIMLIEGAWIVARVQADVEPIRRAVGMFATQYRARR